MAILRVGKEGKCRGRGRGKERGGRDLIVDLCDIAAPAGKGRRRFRDQGEARLAN